MGAEIIRLIVKQELKSKGKSDVLHLLFSINNKVNRRTSKEKRDVSSIKQFPFNKPDISFYTLLFSFFKTSHFPFNTFLPGGLL